MKPNAKSLDHLQSNNVFAVEAVEIRKDLIDCYRNDPEASSWLENAEERFIKSVPDIWFVANLLHPKSSYLF